MILLLHNEIIMTQNLDRFEDQRSNILTLIKENLLKEGNLSIRGLALICEISDRAIIRDAHFRPQKLGQIMEEHGFSGADLTKNGFNERATWLVIEYFAFESKAKAPGAKQIARTFGSYGIHQLFEQLNQEKTKQLPSKIRINQLETQNSQLQLSLTESRELAQKNQEKANILDSIVYDDDTLLSMQDFGAVLGIGRTTLFKYLRELGIICKHSTVPLGKYLKGGCFIRKYVRTNYGYYRVTRITGKGVAYCTEKLLEGGYLA